MENMENTYGEPLISRVIPELIFQRRMLQGLIELRTPFNGMSKNNQGPDETEIDNLS